MSSLNIDGYQVFEEIGRGGSGVVYRALELDTQRDVAIKILEDHQTNDPQFIQRFTREARFVAQLEHPHIVPLYTARREANRAYLIMRLLRGYSLRNWLTQRGPLSLPSAAQMLDQICLALTYAHRRNVVHRDVKPGNILLDEEGNFYLTDFGIAMNLRGIEIGGIGTPAYASPEQWQGATATPHSDIYSMGITLYESLTVQNPFNTGTPARLGERHLRELLPPLSQTNPKLTEGLDAVIERSTAKEPGNRYPDAISMAQEFHRLVFAHEERWPTIVTAPSSGILAAEADTPSPENPYKGLSAFKETDAIDFFGRDRLIEQLIKRLSEQPDAANFLALVGASGSGKTSVVRAGLFPALRNGRLPGAQNWLLVDMTPGGQPFQNLESAVKQVALRSVTGLAEQMQKDTHGLLDAIQAALPQDGKDLLLFIDQFEELFTVFENEAERARFLDNLVMAVRAPGSRLRVIIALRADYYDRPLAYPLFADLLRYRVETIVPLSPDEVREAITRPAERVNLVLEAGLADALIRDTANQPGALPLLQYTLTELCKRREGNRLTLASYKANGGLSGSVTKRADEIYAELSPTGQEIARQLFMRLVVFGAGLETTRQRVKRSELTALKARPNSLADDWNVTEINKVLDKFNAFRLLTFDYDQVTHSPSVEIAHEILIHAWDRLADWLNTGREEIQLHRHLVSAVHDWTAAGRDPSYLVSGARLSRLETLLSGVSLVLNDEEHAYLKASIAERHRQETQREAQQRRLLGLQRAVIGILVVSFLVAAGLSVFALDNRNTALTEARNAFARQLAAQAVGELQQPVGNDEYAALLAIRSLNIRYDPLADQALVEAANRLPLAVLKGHTDEIYGIAFSPDGKYILTGSADHTARLWSLDGKEIRRFVGHQLDVWSVAFSPDGKYVLTGSGDKTAKLWETATGKEIRTFTGHQNVIFSVAYSADGKYVLTGGADKSGKLWNAATGQAIFTFGCNDADVQSVAFSPDGKYIAAGCSEFSVKVIEIATSKEVHTFQGHNGGVYAIAFSPDSQYVLSGSLDDTAKLWNVASGKEVRTFRGHSNSIRSVAFMPDGKTILTGSRDYTARLWDVATGQQIHAFRGHNAGLYAAALSRDGNCIATGGSDMTAKLWEVSSDTRARIFRGHTGEVWSVAFSPDGKSVLTSSADKTIRLWTSDGGKLLRTFIGHDEDVWTAIFSPDGKFVLTTSSDRSVRLWDIVTGTVVRTFIGHAEAIYSAVFSADGKFLVTGSGDKTAKLWDVSSGKELRTFIGHTDFVEHVAISPDGKYLATASADRLAKVWDIATGQLLLTLAGHTGQLYGVAFSPEGKYVLTGSDDSTAMLWDVATGQLVRTFRGHTRDVYGVAYSADGKYIITASADRTAKIWDVATGQQLRTLSGHNEGIWSVAFSPDGKTALTGSLDYTARLWDTDYHVFIADTCRRLLRDLTDKERAQIPLPDTDTSPTCPALMP